MQRLLPTVLLAFLPCAIFAQSVAASSHAQKKPIKTTATSGSPQTEQEKARQILDRFTFGPRPGEVDAVAKMGVDQWLERQLNPQSIPDPAASARLAEFPSLNLAPAQIATEFPKNPIIGQVTEGKQPYPQDPRLAAVYQVLVQKYQEQQTAKQDNRSRDQLEAAKAAQKKRDQAGALPIAEQLLGLPKGQRLDALLKLPVSQRIVLTESAPEPQKTMLLNDFTPRERELFYEMAGGPDAAHVIDCELQDAKVVRAILSERQLQEVMTDFWFNHFNVFINKESDQIYTPDYEQSAIRANALGKFRDLLLATAQHPAMLVYLDNWLSIGPDSVAAQKAKVQRGLNENYGREVMELHTVGVDGGYSQQDVTNLAKILTGWSVQKPNEGGGFVFDERRHEPGSKQWFGHTVLENGYEEGKQALVWLAAQPQTAHFISYKLAQRFVADDPPPALVDRMAKSFLSSDGDIREVLLTMVHSPEFFSRRYYRSKVKTPLEFVASAFRATETDPSNPAAIVNVLRTMGEPLYQAQPPTGYPMTAEHWMNSAALVDRLNFSLSLANSELGKMKFDAPHLLAAGLLAQPAPEAGNSQIRRAAIEGTAGRPSGEDQAISIMEQMLISGDVSASSTAVIHRALAEEQAKQASPADPTQVLNTVTALVLGSPEFQMR